MKIALFFHGQPRYIEQNYQKIKDTIIDTYNPDVYCQTWWDSEVTINQYVTRTELFTTQNNIPALLEHLYAPKSIRAEPPLRDMYQKYTNLSKFQNIPSIDSTLSQFLSIKNASTMFNWEDYDFILKWRYDYSPIDFPSLETLDRNYMYTYTDYHHTFYDDPLFFIDSCYILPSSLKKVVEIFDYLTSVDCSVEKCIKYGNSPEALYKNYVEELGYQSRIKKLPFEEFTCMHIR